MSDIQSAIQLVIQLVSAEVALYFNLKDDVNSIKSELQYISSRLMNAEERAEGDDAAKEWLIQVREFTFDIEDAIERYQLFLKKSRISQLKHHVLGDVSDMASKMKSLLEMATRITAGGDRLVFSSDNSTQRGQCSNHQGSQSRSLSQCTTMTAGYEVVEDEIAKKEIIGLLGFQNVDGRPSTVAVVGMRGLGKTTVVQSVFYDNTIRSQFPVRAWIPVSECRQEDAILRSMIEKFSTATDKLYSKSIVNNMDEGSLQHLLQNYIQGKRYMIVFDNVQEGDVEVTKNIKALLDTNKENSKILITTRYENVAHAWLKGSSKCLYKLKHLPENKAWELFCKTAFHGSSESCPSRLHDLAHGIVEKCGGLPPVITSVGSLLSNRADDLNEWSKVHHSLGFYLEDSNDQLAGINRAFMQSYYDLPFKLRPCFLYFGLFPEGYPIARMRLIRLWIAEGFIRECRGSLTLEEVAGEYMNDLINMSMIEVKSRDSSGRVETLGVVSKFLHEIILSKLHELSFCKILSEKGSSGKARRLSIHKNHECHALELDDIMKKPSSIRSLLLQDVKPPIMVKVFDDRFLESVSLLRVLDLLNAPVDSIPKEVGTLLNLRYLSLRGTRVSKIPITIGKLEKLQTLDLKQTFISELPKEFNQLHNLRHLLGYYYQHDLSDVHCMKTNGVKIPEGLLVRCSQLQKLAFLDLNASHINWVMELRHLTQLRKLGITGLKSDDGQAMCYVIDGLNNLQALSVFSKSKTECIDLRNVGSPPPMLNRLYLSGPLPLFPTWISRLQNLVKIRLRWSFLPVDPLESLRLLPNLVELQLLEAFIGEELIITNHGFQKLKVLHLLDLHPLKFLYIAEGGLPLLDELSIGESENLEVPSTIKYLSTLKTLNFYNMPPHFTKCILPGQSEHSFVEHIPSIRIYNKDSRGILKKFPLNLHEVRNHIQFEEWYHRLL